jgi:lysophospholipase L1-like esterase
MNTYVETTQSDTGTNLGKKILTIGDSFTDGADILIPLKQILQSKKYKSTFIGTRSNSDIHHEGRGGWTAAAYMNLNRKWYPNSPFLNGTRLDFNYYFHNILKDTPDIVMIQLGVNDVLGLTKGITKGYYNYDNIKDKVNNLKLMVNSIKGVLPKVKIVMIMPTQSSSKFKNSVDPVKYQDILDNYYKHYLSAFEHKESNGIYIVKTNNILDRSSDFIDFVHPNKEGYKKIAEKIVEVLQKI